MSAAIAPSDVQVTALAGLLRESFRLSGDAHDRYVAAARMAWEFVAEHAAVASLVQKGPHE